MWLIDPADEEHPLVVAYRAARAEVRQSVRAQWAALAAGGMASFLPAHEAARRAAEAAHVAEQAVYDAGLAFLPLCWVRPGVHAGR